SVRRAQWCALSPGGGSPAKVRYLLAGTGSVHSSAAGAQAPDPDRRTSDLPHACARVRGTHSARTPRLAALVAPWMGVADRSQICSPPVRLSRRTHHHRRVSGSARSARRRIQLCQLLTSSGLALLGGGVRTCQSLLPRRPCDA